MDRMVVSVPHVEGFGFGVTLRPRYVRHRDAGWSRRERNSALRQLEVRHCRRVELGVVRRYAVPSSYQLFEGVGVTLASATRGGGWGWWWCPYRGQASNAMRGSPRFGNWRFATVAGSGLEKWGGTPFLVPVSFFEGVGVTLRQ
jgi:hypothetical protein